MIIKPKLIAIDLDGTLVDSVPDLLFCANKVMQKLNRPIWQEGDVRQWVGEGVLKLVQKMLRSSISPATDKEQYDKAYRLFVECYKNNFANKSKLYDGVIEGLNYLQTSGYKISCITNKARVFTYPLLEHFNILDMFQLIITGDDLSKKKPDPMPLLYAADYFKLPPNQCLMIGDSIYDIKAAKSAGFGVICVSYGYNHSKDIRSANPDLIIDSFMETAYYL